MKYYTKNKIRTSEKVNTKFEIARLIKKLNSLKLMESVLENKNRSAQVGKTQTPNYK